MANHVWLTDSWRICRRLLRKSPVYSLVLVACGVCVVRGEGQLQSIRDDVRSPKNSSWFDWNHDDDHHHCHCDDDENSFTEFFGTVGFYLVTSPF